MSKDKNAINLSHSPIEVDINGRLAQRAARPLDDIVQYLVWYASRHSAFSCTISRALDIDCPTGQFEPGYTQI